MIIELKWQTIYFLKTVNERKMTGAHIQRKRKKEMVGKKTEGMRPVGSILSLKSDPSFKQ